MSTSATETTQATDSSSGPNLFITVNQTRTNQYWNHNPDEMADHTDPFLNGTVCISQVHLNPTAEDADPDPFADTLFVSRRLDRFSRLTGPQKEVMRAFAEETADAEATLARLRGLLETHGVKRAPFLRGTRIPTPAALDGAPYIEITDAYRDACRLVMVRNVSRHGTPMFVTLRPADPPAGPLLPDPEETREIRGAEEGQ